MRAWGLEIFALDPREYSASLTGVLMPAGHDADRARNNLKQTLFQLRQDLHEDVFVRTAGVLRLEPGAISLSLAIDCRNSIAVRKAWSWKANSPVLNS